MGRRSGGLSGQTRTGTQDGDLQSGTDNGGHGGAGSSGRHGGAGSSGGHGRWSFMAVASSLGQATPAGTLLPPPPQISLGKLGGIRSPPGLDTQNSTRQDRKALRSQTDRTGQPTGTGSPPGLARKLRLPLGMTSQGPSQGPSATASTSATGGQAARMASMATTRGAACPRRVSVDMTR